ncbi:C-C motif chemokine 23-like [Perognathus longimembris pacificus]|uniref:C-C motif chemokine 23-like n=1 Tax=Perognathus longimembris pacificus TaxID=214514 RepID=UPI002019AF64|nr:C-C motif chemokine 23-like [Perognathus longimembris pacificus]
MHIPIATLSFLLLAATLGFQAWVTGESKLEEFLEARHQHGPTIIHQGISRPSDCCFSYTSRRIRCSIIKDYFLTSNGCPQPGIIVITKRGQRVCVNPRDPRIQTCLGMLNVTTRTVNLRVHEREES